MSITFTIRGDRDESVVEELECAYEGPECRNPKCPDCRGKGVTVLKSSKWEMNVAGGNASMILSSLGFPCDDCCGTINANALLKAIDSCSADRMVRAEYTEGNFISCGVDHRRATRYLTRLREIAVEAARREELVCWG